MRKSDSIRKKLQDKNDKILEELKRSKEIEEELKQAEIDEKEKFESIRDQITKISEENDMFCGIILTPEDIANIVKLAIDSEDKKISIPFNLYYKQT